MSRSNIKNEGVSQAVPNNTTVKFVGIEQANGAELDTWGVMVSSGRKGMEDVDYRASLLHHRSGPIAASTVLPKSDRDDRFNKAYIEWCFSQSPAGQPFKVDMGEIEDKVSDRLVSWQHCSTTVKLEALEGVVFAFRTIDATKTAIRYTVKGGDKKEIAKVIWLDKGLGEELLGSTEVLVDDLLVSTAIMVRFDYHEVTGELAYPELKDQMANLHDEKQGYLVSKDECSEFTDKQIKWLLQRNNQTPVDLKLNLNNEESNMSNTRRVVKVQLIDDDKGLPVENSLVLDLDGIVTQDNDETTIREVLMGYEVGDLLNNHNELRATIVDNEILCRTGNEVKLRPINLKDLRWVVTG